MSVTAFISYSHDSAEHKENVRGLATFLRAEMGVLVTLDQWDDDGRRDWAQWASRSLARADFIIVIASPAYKRRAEGDAPSNEGRGAQFEAAMIRDHLTRDLAGMTRRILPVVLPGMRVEDIPVFLNPYSTTHYVVPEITADALEDLRIALTGVPRYGPPPVGTFKPPVRTTAHPVVVAHAVSPVPSTEILAPGAEIVIGGAAYLVHSAYFDERQSGDSSVIRRQARALRIGADSGHVWIRQVEVRAAGTVAQAAVAALHREHKIVQELRAPGIPEFLALVEDSRFVSAITRWADGEGASALAEFLPRTGRPVGFEDVSWLVKGMAGVCRTLVRLHKSGHTHRALTPGSILVTGKGRLLVRDLGLAAVAPSPGEADGDYQAPEQQRLGRGRTGPWTDVYGVAAVTYHLLTGRSPAQAFRLPVRTPGVPRGLAEAVDSALAADVPNRPGMPELISALSGAFEGGPRR